MGDPDFLDHASSQLLFTAIGVYQMQLLLGLWESVDETELWQHLEQIVDDFLTLYRA